MSVRRYVCLQPSSVRTNTVIKPNFVFKQPPLTVITFKTCQRANNGLEWALTNTDVQVLTSSLTSGIDFFLGLMSGMASIPLKKGLSLERDKKLA